MRLRCYPLPALSTPSSSSGAERSFPPPPLALSAPSSSSGAERSFPPPSPLALSAPSCSSSGAERSLLLLLLLPPPQLLSIRIAVLCPSRSQLAQHSTHATSVGGEPEIDDQDASKRETSVGRPGQVPESEVGYSDTHSQSAAKGEQREQEGDLHAKGVSDSCSAASQSLAQLVPHSKPRG